MSQAAQPTPVRSHRVAALALVAAGTITAFLAIGALWINRQALDTENWTETSSKLLEDHAIRTALSGYLVDQLYANVDVTGEIQGVLPPRAAPLAAPAAGALRDLAEKATNELLQRPRVQELWENANRAAHGLLLKILHGGGPLASTTNGVVTLDLRELLRQLAERTGVGGGLVAKIPEDAAQLTVLRSDQLAFAQDVANALRPLAILLLVLTLALYAAAIALARGRRRETLRAVGFGFVVAGVLALLARKLGGGALVDALASTEAVRPAVESAWGIGTSLLVEAATASIGYGVVMILGAWLAGPTRAAVATRRGLAPYLRVPRYAWGGAAAIVVLVLIWSPTPATRKVVPALILIGLLAIGVEALRRQVAREHPGATTPEFGESLRHGFERLRAMPGHLRHSHNGHTRVPVVEGPATTAVPAAVAPVVAAPVAPVADPVDRLERLAALRDRGVLTESEFDDQKRAILTAG